MQAFEKHEGIIAVLDRSDVDTDQIIPKQFLKKIGKSGFGLNLFHSWRFLDADGKNPNPDFELNQERYTGASILIAGQNFGCGSSREHAPWALMDYGFRVIIAPSYADIFYSNSLKNGILLICLPREQIQNIINWVLENEFAKVSVDLFQQILEANGCIYNFEIDAFQKENLLQGRDEISLSLTHENVIHKFEKDYFQKFPFYLPQK